ncbi:MAG TPA: AAA family ATPase [Polyangiaceae bacterium]|nr:AAA family ATPase [Polyangiaceae bacterium]
MTALEPALSAAAATKAKLRRAIGEVVVGQDDVVDQVLWALVAGGHVLLEGAPGLGKTLLVRTLAASLDLRFSRIQFTPDLMPSDVIGASVLVLDPAGRSSGRFELHRGPIFGQLVLADEINRAPPKTQSALLEAMQEHAVTIAGSRQKLEEPFMVLATENPIEMEGTYPLPEAQLDRFLLKVLVSSPSEDDLVRILERTTAASDVAAAAVLGSAEVLALRELCRRIVVAEPVLRYVARLVAATDPSHPSAPPEVKRAVRYGASVRGAQALTLAAKAVALFDGRAHVALADVAKVALPALRHRIIRSFEGEAAGIGADAVVETVLSAVPARPEAVEKAAREQ